MKPSEILVKARALIEDEKHWTQCAAARNSKGRAVLCRDRNAVRWCAFGAVCKICRVEHCSTLTPIRGLDVAASTLSNIKDMSLTVFNDMRKHHEVLKMFDLAIELAEAEE